MLPETLFIIKPDAMQQHKGGLILAMIEANEFTMTKLALMIPQRSLIEKHYEEHQGKPFYDDLIKSMYTQTPIIAGTLVMKKKPNHVHAAFRKLVGHYNDPAPNTIRYLYMTDSMRNAIHGSADEIDARREIALWYKWLL